jgi:hypothetical protein
MLGAIVLIGACNIDMICCKLLVFVGEVLNRDEWKQVNSAGKKGSL